MTRADEPFYRRLAAEAGLRYVALDETPPDPALARLVPSELARRFRVVAHGAGDDVLTVASARPHDRGIFAALAALTGKRVELVVSTPAQIDDAVELLYGPAPVVRASRFASPRRGDVDPRGLAAEAGLRFDPELDAEDADPAAAAFLTEPICRRLCVAPLRASRGELLLAVAAPLAARELVVVTSASAHVVRQTVVPRERIVRILDRVYGDPARAGSQAPSWRAHDPSRRLGEMLVSAGLLTRAQLRSALAAQRRTGDQLGELLVSRRVVTSDAIARTLADQLRIPYVAEDALRTQPGLEHALPDDVARRHLMIPLEEVRGSLVVAMADPVDPDAVKALRIATSSPTRVVVASATAIRAALDRLQAPLYAELSTTQLLRRRPDESAHVTLSDAQRVVFVAVVAAVLLGMLVSWRYTLIVLIILSTAFYVGSTIFKFALVYRTMRVTNPELPVTETELALLDESTLPTYTVLVPLYHEAAVLDQLVDSLRQLDYPPTKLDIKLLLEEDDAETTLAARSLSLEEHFHLVYVPAGEPRTKPKACNFGLQHARGDFVVIYDAEDIPDPEQLKKAVVAFRKASHDVVCVQAKLNYWNREQNLLTRWFTTEYSQWFDLFLPGLDAIGGPIPLGGTSNHFPTRALIELGAWDPYNVTEDADVGIRLARRGYRTAIIDSTTYEEANSRTYNWIRQRSRWIKGYIQTWLVHMRHPVHLWKELGPVRFVSFQLVVGGTFLTMLLNPFFWGLTSVWAVTEAGWIRELFPGTIYFLSAGNLLIGNFVFTYVNVVGTLRRGYDELVRAALFSPLYWGLMSVGAWKGFVQLVHRPSYWEKTVHGLASER